MPDCRARATRRAGEIHREDAFERLIVEAVAGRLALDAGIIDQDVEPPPGGDHAIHHRGDRAAVADVGLLDAVRTLAMPGAARGLMQRGQALVRRWSVTQVIDRDRRAFGGESL